MAWIACTVARRRRREPLPHGGGAICRTRPRHARNDVRVTGRGPSCSRLARRGDWSWVPAVTVTTVRPAMDLKMSVILQAVLKPSGRYTLARRAIFTGFMRTPGGARSGEELLGLHLSRWPGRWALRGTALAARASAQRVQRIPSV